MGSPEPRVYILAVLRLRRLLDTAHRLWRSAKSLTCMLTFDRSYLYVYSKLSVRKVKVTPHLGGPRRRGKTVSGPDRSAREHGMPGTPSARVIADYVRVSVQYVKQETLTNTDSGREARATRLITERASRRIGTMAFELALARPRKVFATFIFTLSWLIGGASQQVTIIHKSNVLSVTDGLFRETVRAVPRLPEVSGRFDGVTIAEQIVDSAVYRFGSLLRVS